MFKILIGFRREFAQGQQSKPAENVDSPFNPLEADPSGKRKDQQNGKDNAIVKRLGPDEATQKQPKKRKQYQSRKNLDGDHHVLFPSRHSASDEAC